MLLAKTWETYEKAMSWGPERVGSRSAISCSHLYVLQQVSREDGRQDRCDATAAQSRLNETLQPQQSIPLLITSNTSTIIPVSHVLADTKMRCTLHNIYISKLSKLLLQKHAVTASVTRHSCFSLLILFKLKLEDTGNRSLICWTQVKRAWFSI